MSNRQYQPSWLDKVIRFCLENKLIVGLMVIAVVVWGIIIAPFDWKIDGLPRDPIPTDAIPDISENQQIVFTEWTGRSPRDVDDQVTYPLTVSLLGVPGVKTIRSYSYFGYSMIYVVFDEGIEFYWSRSRILEKLSSLSAGTLPTGVQPALGPDSTALGEIFWYTLEGRDEEDKPTGGWNPDELRTYQDWYVRYALLSADYISDVASVGGFVREYQVDVDPDALKANNVTITEVFNTIRRSNLDVGARSIEVNNVEYFIRGLGFIKNLSDLANSVIKVNDHVPLSIKDVAHVNYGPAIRRGALDKAGIPAVGGVVVVRYGENPLSAIKSVKQQIEQMAAGAPTKAVVDYSQIDPQEAQEFARSQGFEAFTEGELNQQAWQAWLKETPADRRPAWVKLSRVTVVPFYDRTGLIYETLGTLNNALTEEILVTIIVVLIIMMHLRSSFLISALLPLGVLMTFIVMKLFDVPANIVALSGIAIAIGTMVDMGIVISENILRHLAEAPPEKDRLQVVFEASSEVGSAVMTAVATTIVSFLPVFAMIGAEGKLFRPLAFTKTFAFVSALVISLTVIPPFAHVLFTREIRSRTIRTIFYFGLLTSGIAIGISLAWWAGALIVVIALFQLLEEKLPQKARRWFRNFATWLVVLLVGILLAEHWLPLGPERGVVQNVLFVALVVGVVLFLFYLFLRFYNRILAWCLDHKAAFLTLPVLLILFGLLAWQGFAKIFAWLPDAALNSAPVAAIEQVFPGFGEEFMPPLDEGSYLFMPTTMPHAGIGEAQDILEKQDIAISHIPEISQVVGKLGRAKTPLDPAPISMFETTINYKSKYLTDKNGNRIRFRYDPDKIDYFRNEAGKPVPGPDGKPYKVQGCFPRDRLGNLIPDPNGNVFRQWRPPLVEKLNPDRQAWPGVRSPDDIWDEITSVTDVPGTTTAPKLQPIATRIMMLQTGMRAPMGVKVKGPDLKTIEQVGIEIERLLKEVPVVKPDTVIADRIIAKPYIEIDFDRKAIARYGLTIQSVQEAVEVAIGGMQLTTTVEGRERYPVRARYMRELRDDISALGEVFMPAADGTHIPIMQLANIRYTPGPQVIKSEDTFLTSYVIFDKKAGYAEVDVVEECARYLKSKIETGELHIPPGVNYAFSGNYENQVRAARRLSIVMPVALFAVFMILYLQFRVISTTLLVFSGVAIAWAGGFLLIWLYNQPWFLDFALFGTSMRELFQIHTINLSIAVWVGFVALFGISTDNGVLFATYLDEVFTKRKITSIREIRDAAVHAGHLRVRPAVMTTATTILALVPVLTSSGRGSDILVPMAIPSFGGMAVSVLSMLTVPVLYSLVREWRLKHGTG